MMKESKLAIQASGWANNREDTNSHIIDHPPVREPTAPRNTLSVVSSLFIFPFYFLHFSDTRCDTYRQTSTWPSRSAYETFFDNLEGWVITQVCKLGRTNEFAKQKNVLVYLLLALGGFFGKCVVTTCDYNVFSSFRPIRAGAHILISPYATIKLFTRTFKIR